MINFHKFETTVRKPGGKVIPNIQVLVRESNTQAIITRYSDSPYMLGSTYYRFPYISNDGNIKFYLPTGTYDIYLSDGEQDRVFTGVQIGKLVGYDFEDLSDQGYYHWQRVLFNSDGFLESEKTLTIERYAGSQTKYPATFIDANGELQTEAVVTHDVNIQMLPGLYRITLSDGDAVYRIFDHEEVGYFEGDEGEDAKCSLWQGIEW
jgi:hypothetical protein